MFRLPKKLFYCLLFVLVLFIVTTGDDGFIARSLYPFPYREIVVSEANKYEIDPLLIISVIRVESSFNQTALSEKGARGLMQIMPDTGYWIAEMIGLDDFCEECFYDPGVNISLGAWYINDLLRQFNDNLYQALAAYNGGRGNVSNWLSEGIWDGEKENLADIPFSETRSFIQKVERSYQRYQQIYPLERYLSDVSAERNLVAMRELGAVYTFRPDFLRQVFLFDPDKSAFFKKTRLIGQGEYVFYAQIGALPD